MTVTLLFVLPSATFGMHQYTADLARQAAGLGHTVHVVTTRALPRDRYHTTATLHTPVTLHTTGFGREGVQPAALLALRRRLLELRPDVVHFTGVHLWNPLLLADLRRLGIRTVHTLHDLDPHPGVRFAGLIRLWNRMVASTAGALLVHAGRYRTRLLQAGARRVHCWPLLHTFLGAEAESTLDASPPARTWEPWVLLFGRLTPYKGVPVLLNAAHRLAARGDVALPSAVLAGRSDGSPLPLPAGVIHLDRHASDALGWDLFSRCRAVVLPYTGATQSALPAAAYAFGKPVIVSDSGALAESVLPDRSGWVVPTGDAEALAAVMAAVARRPAAELAACGDAGRAWRQAARARERRLMEGLYA